MGLVGRRDDLDLHRGRRKFRQLLGEALGHALLRVRGRGRGRGRGKGRGRGRGRGRDRVRARGIHHATCITPSMRWVVVPCRPRPVPRHSGRLA